MGLEARCEDLIEGERKKGSGSLGFGMVTSVGVAIT